MRHRHPLLHRLWRVALWVFPMVVLVLLARAARGIDWAQVVGALAAYETTSLLVAFLLTVASYLVYSSYDLAARRYAHHALRTGRVMLIAAIAYAFALNIGALVGGTGLRLRMYAHAGLPLPTTVRVIAFSTSTNWLGYLLLGGVLFASVGVEPPPRFAVAATALQALGFAMLATSMAYLYACHRLHGRVFHVRGQHFRLPPVPLALLQLLLAAGNWSLMAAILYALLPAPAEYTTVLGTLLFAAVATAMAHVPAGLGVMEAVFVAALGHRIEPAQVLAALLAYRAIYYLGPLLLALLGYVQIEVRGRRAPTPGATPGNP